MKCEWKIYIYSWLAQWVSKITANSLCDWSSISFQRPWQCLNMLSLPSSVIHLAEYIYRYYFFWKQYCSILVVIRTQRSRLLSHGLDIFTSIGHLGGLLRFYHHFRRQNCTDNAQEETALSAVSYKNTHTQRKIKQNEAKQNKNEKWSYKQQVFLDPFLRCN